MSIAPDRAHWLDELTLDALVSAGVLHDDSLVVNLHAYKRWSVWTGCSLIISGES